MCFHNTANTVDDCRKNTMPVALIRGLSDIPLPNIADLVVRAFEDDELKSRGLPYSQISAQDLDVKDCSGHGGCRTFKVSAKDPENKDLPPIVVHSRQNDRPEHFMKRLSDAHAALAAAELAPPRLAEGGSWFLGRWDGVGKPECRTEEDCVRQGRLMGQVHSVDPSWFDEHRAALVKLAPHLADADETSHVWAYASRGHHGDNMCNLFTTGAFATADGEEGIWREYLDMGPLSPRHPIAKRLVTAHGDLHNGNVLDLGGGKLGCIDFEFTCAMGAYHDLGSLMAQASWAYDEHKKDEDPAVSGLSVYERQRAMLRGYLAALGEEADLDELMLDIKLAGGASHFHHRWSVFTPWEHPKSSPSTLRAKLELHKAFAAEARADPDLAHRIVHEDPQHDAMNEHPLFVEAAEKELAEDEVYQARQKELEQATPLLLRRQSSLQAEYDAREIDYVEVDAPAMPQAEPMAGAELVCIRASQENSLAIQVKPGTGRLELAEYQPGLENQMWRWLDGRLQHAETGLYLDAPVAYAFNHRPKPWHASTGDLSVQPRGEAERQEWVLDGELLRHRIDGRTLDVNFWKLAPGLGVNLNVAHTSKRGCSWALTRVEDGEAVEAAEIMLGAQPAPKAETPLAEGLQDEEFYIACAANHGFGLAVGKCDKDPKKVKLSALTGDQRQKWRLVDNDGFQNVSSGLFLDSELKYAFITDARHPWEDNHTALTTAPRNLNGQQKWVYGPEEFHGGKVLRHWLDGRGVDVHGWKVDGDGGNMGVENSVHSDCKGICYVFLPCNQYDDAAEEKAKAEKNALESSSKL